MCSCIHSKLCLVYAGVQAFPVLFWCTAWVVALDQVCTLIMTLWQLEWWHWIRFVLSLWRHDSLSGGTGSGLYCHVTSCVVHIHAPSSTDVVCSWQGLAPAWRRQYEMSTRCRIWWTVLWLRTLLERVRFSTTTACSVWLGYSGQCKHWYIYCCFC